jgi:hypothetical protein
MRVFSRADNLIGLPFGIEFEFLFEKETQVGMVQISVCKGAREIVEPFTRIASSPSCESKYDTMTWNVNCLGALCYHFPSGFPETEAKTKHP